MKPIDKDRFVEANDFLAKAVTVIQKQRGTYLGLLHQCLRTFGVRIYHKGRKYAIPTL
jgi:hypothetical protein